jgi:uncharacterized protein (TIGR03437 family)
LDVVTGLITVVAGNGTTGFSGDDGPATPAVTIGGAPATVLFSGLAPGSAGEYQVDALVPAASSKGGAVPVVISIGGATSNTVTIAVESGYFVHFTQKRH